MLKHVFYKLSYAITTQLRKQIKMSLATSNQLHDTNFNQIPFIDWSKVFIMSKHVFYNMSYATIMSNMINKMTKNVFSN
jgi:hypothetical protein